MKQLAPIATCLLLTVAAPGLASGADSAPSIDPATLGGPTAYAPAYETAYDTGHTVLDALEMKGVVGTGPGTDFACGFISGAGLMMTLSGVASPVGVSLAVAGAVCSLLF